MCPKPVVTLLVGSLLLFGSVLLATPTASSINTATSHFKPLTTSSATAIAAGGEHTCALTTASGVKCWGRNEHGQLGDGTVGSYASKNAPMDVVGLSSGVAAITAGDSYTCALNIAGGVKCWGNNFSGQLGNGTSGFDHYEFTPVDVVGLGSGVSAIAAGRSHTCALIIATGIKCWGDNNSGELGDGTTSRQPIPVDVVGLGSGVAAIAVGREHTCALTTVGGVKCWGSNRFGQLGDGTTSRQPIPVDAVGLGSGVVAITAGGEHTCALTTATGVKCWGHNEFGQLGDGTAGWSVSKNTPVDVVGLGSGVAAIVADSQHTCALTTVGGVKCWGRNEYGQLGDESTTDRSTPVDIIDLGSGVAAIAAGRSHTCALTAAGGVKCWGRNEYGQLGHGGTTNKNTPVDVTNLGSGVAAIAAGDAHACTLTTVDGIRCWGGNSSGQLGDGGTRNKRQYRKSCYEAKRSPEVERSARDRDSQEYDSNFCGTAIRVSPWM